MNFERAASSCSLPVRHYNIISFLLATVEAMQHSPRRIQYQVTVEVQQQFETAHPPQAPCFAWYATTLLPSAGDRAKACGLKGWKARFILMCPTKSVAPGCANLCTLQIRLRCVSERVVLSQYLSLREATSSAHSNLNGKTSDDDSST